MKVFEPSRIRKALSAEPTHITDKPVARYPDERFVSTHQKHQIVSNEFALFKLFPTIQKVKGAALGVGFDQMLDIAVNSQLEEILIVDFLKSVSLATRLVLEVGRIHHQLLNEYPNPDTLLAYLAPENHALTLEMVQGCFTHQDQKVIAQSLADTLESTSVNQPSVPTLYHYLTYKRYQTYYPSWVSHPDNLARVIQLYERGAIQVVRADLTSPKVVPTIAVDLQQRNQTISLFYFSNLEMFLGQNTEQQQGFEHNVAQFPCNAQTLCLTTCRGKGSPPAEVLEDPHLKKLAISWDYLLQTMTDRQATQAGHYMVRVGGAEERIWDVADRVYAVQEIGVAAHDMNLAILEEGVVVAGLW